MGIAREIARPFLKLLGLIRRKVMAGILVVVPIGLTIWILLFLFRLFDNLLSPILRQYVSIYIPGFGIVVAVSLLYLIGVFVTNVIGRGIHYYFERLMLSMPIVKNIYNGIKQLVETVTLPNRRAFKEVVLVEYPSPGLKVVGFLTGHSIDKMGNKLYHVFIPTSPNPTSGMLELVTEDKVFKTKWTLEEGLKMVVSGGVLVPPNREGDFLSESSINGNADNS